MDAERIAVGLLGLGTVVVVVGALVSLSANTLNGEFSRQAGAVVILLVVSLLAAVVAGMRGKEWLDNPGYW